MTADEGMRHTPVEDFLALITGTLVVAVGLVLEHPVVVLPVVAAVQEHPELPEHLELLI